MSDIGDNLLDIIKLLSSIKKDAERKKAIDAINEAHREFLKAEVSGRRIKSSEIIRDIAMVDRALEEFEITYEYLKISGEVYEIQSLNDCIRDIKKYRKKLVNEKKRGF